MSDYNLNGKFKLFIQKCCVGELLLISEKILTWKNNLIEVLTSVTINCLYNI